MSFQYERPERKGCGYYVILFSAVIVVGFFLFFCTLVGAGCVTAMLERRPNDQAVPPAKQAKQPPAVGKAVGPAIYAWDHADSMFNGAGKDRIERELGEPDLKTRKWWYYDNRQAQSGEFDVAFHFNAKGVADSVIVQKSSPNRVRQKDD